MANAEIKWSYSALKQYVNCPKQYYHLRVLKDVVQKVTPQMMYGTEIHKLIENYLTKGSPLEDIYLKTTVDYIQSTLDGMRYVEHKMALDSTGAPVACDADNYWVRGIADLIITDGDVAYCIDWKTGNDRYADVKQLRLMSLMIFAHFPHINKVESLLHFTKSGIPVVDKTHYRESHEELWAEFAPDLMKLQVSHDTNIWPMKPSNLCGWCAVVHCQNYRDRE